jgi:hypothetical protein
VGGKIQQTNNRWALCPRKRWWPATKTKLSSAAMTVNVAKSWKTPVTLSDWTTITILVTRVCKFSNVSSSETHLKIWHFTLAHVYQRSDYNAQCGEKKKRERHSLPCKGVEIPASDRTAWIIDSELGINLSKTLDGKWDHFRRNEKWDKAFSTLHPRIRSSTQ